MYVFHQILGASTSFILIFASCAYVFAIKRSSNEVLYNMKHFMSYAGDYVTVYSTK